jgi:hypothetical protein
MQKGEAIDSNEMRRVYSGGTREGVFKGHFDKVRAAAPEVL